MKLLINSNALVSFNKKAESLLNQIVKSTLKLPTLPVGAPTPQFHVHNVAAEDIIGDIIMSQTDIDGVILSRFAPVNGEQVGLEGAEYKKLRLLAEEIYNRPEVNHYISSSAVEDILFKWVIARYSEKSSETMTDFCLPIWEASIVNLNIWVPVFGIATYFGFELGRTKVLMMQEQFFDHLERLFVHGFEPIKADQKLRIDGLRKKFQGWAACTMSIEAEPKRANEIATEESENALALLRICLPTALHPSMPSYCRPAGKENIEKETVFSFEGPSRLLLYESVSSSFRPWILDQEQFDKLGQFGIGELHRLYIAENKTEFQRELLKSLMLYSRSSLKQEASDRLIYIFTALDSFLLQSQSEPIQQNIAERIAFTISDDAKERPKIKKNIIAAYGMRSQSVHHNQGIQNRDTMIEFLGYVFRFFILLAHRSDKYKNRQEFFDDVESKKWTTNSPQVDLT